MDLIPHSSKIAIPSGFLQKHVHKDFFFFTLLLLLLATVLSDTFAGTFSKLPTTGAHPSERSSAVAAGLSPYIYLFGGVKDDYSKPVNTFYNDLYRLNTQTNVWEKVTPNGDLPSPRAFAVAAADPTNNVIWVFGGANFKVDYSDLTMFDDLWSYSPAKNTWTKVKAANQGPGHRAKSNMWMVGTKLYIFGGAKKDFTMYNDMWVYDTKTNKWNQLIPNDAAGSPTPRDEAQAGNVPTSTGLLIIYGGEGFNQGTFVTYNDTWIFNINTNKWSNVTPKDVLKNVLPTRHFGASAVIENEMFLQGGNLEGIGTFACVHPPFPQRPVGDDLWRYQVNLNVWNKIGACGEAIPRLKRTTATAMDGKMYIFLGFDFQCYDTTGPGQLWNMNDYSYDPKS